MHWKELQQIFKNAVQISKVNLSIDTITSVYVNNSAVRLNHINELRNSLVEGFLNNRSKKDTGNNYNSWMKRPAMELVYLDLKDSYVPTIEQNLFKEGRGIQLIIRSHKIEQLNSK